MMAWQSKLVFVLRKPSAWSKICEQIQSLPKWFTFYAFHLSLLAERLAKGIIWLFFADAVAKQTGMLDPRHDKLSCIPKTSYHNSDLTIKMTKLSS